MTSNNETVSRQNRWTGNTAKSMTSEGNIALLPGNVDQRSLPALLQRSNRIRETKLTFSRANSHWVFNSLVGYEHLNFFFRDHFLYSPAFYQTVGGYKEIRSVWLLFNSITTLEKVRMIMMIMVTVRMMMTMIMMTMMMMLTNLFNVSY